MAGMSGDPIAGYLTELRAGLRTPPARTAEIVAEAEDHLRESAAAVRQAGHLSETAAQQAAIEAFGPVRRIVRAHRPPVTAFAAAAGLRASPLLPAYVLLSALMGALLLWLDIVTNHGHSLVPVVTTDHLRRDQKTIVFLGIGTPSPGQAAAVFGGCVLAGVLLIAGITTVRQRRLRLGLAPARPSRGLSLLASVIALLALAFAEYRFYAGDVMGTLHVADGIADLILGSQWAAVLMGAGWALRTLLSLVRWALPGRRAGNQAPPGNADLAPV
jgi:hypothetical protein